MTTEGDMAPRVFQSSINDAGFHSSPSDLNDHLSIKNAEGTVIGHDYANGLIKGTNQEGSGALSWLMPKPE